MWPRLGRVMISLAVATSTAAQGNPFIPRYDHVVVVIFANKSANAIYRTASAPYINALITSGSWFANSYAVTSPDQPNYLAIFSGSTQGVVSDTCPQTFNAPNLAQQLSDAGLSFAQYSEGLATVGETSCSDSNGLYNRRHNPEADFASVLVTANLPYSDFSSALANATLPTVSFVVPNLCNDMHGNSTYCTTNLVALGDQWLQNNIPSYMTSSSGHNGLLIVTWDEDDGTLGNNNHIPTFFYGPHVKAGYTSTTTINHYNLLRTLEDMYGLSALGNAATAAPITDVWDDTIFSNGFEM